MMTFRVLGLQAYEPIWRAMQRFTETRHNDTQDEIWFVEHLPVYTQGMAGKPEHVLNPQQIPVVAIDRGGQVTYHGPGQLVVYFLLNVEKRQLAPRQLVTKIEHSLIELLKAYDLESYARQDAPGIYIDGAKIASIGLRIRRQSSYHGLALNVDMDLTPFKGINPCGYADLPMTQLKNFVETITMNDVGQKLKLILEKIFHES